MRKFLWGCSLEYGLGHFRITLADSKAKEIEQSMRRHHALLHGCLFNLREDMPKMSVSIPYSLRTRPHARVVQHETGSNILLRSFNAEWIQNSLLTKLTCKVRTSGTVQPFRVTHFLTSLSVSLFP